MVDAGGLDPVRGGGNVLLAENLDAQMIDALARARALEQHELERRVVDGEIGVARLALVDRRVEHLRVEVDGLFEIVHIEGELQAHGSLLQGRAGGRQAPWQQLSVRNRSNASMRGKSAA